MTDLIAELERATEGSRFLSDKILSETKWTINYNDERAWLSRPNFTESLDAAVMLADNQSWTIYSAYADKPPRVVVGRDHVGEGATPILSFCIAALKAKQAQAVERETA